MIRVETLRKRFGATVVVDGLDLAIPSGQRVALVGSNGAGKTTLLRCLLGEYRYEGAITIDGLSPLTQRTAVLSRIAFVPQLPPPLRMPVGELIRYVARVTDADPARIEDIAHRLGLAIEPIRSRPFVKLSGGQKQKLLVAAALGRDVGVLILDEPAANLDPAARAVLFELMAERREATMIISSHRLDEIAGLVSRVVELDHGRIVLDDRVAGADALDRRFACRITLAQPDAAFARHAAEWRLEPDAAGLVWRGSVAAPDRLRFFAVVARYSGLVAGLALEDEHHVDPAA